MIKYLLVLSLLLAGCSDDGVTTLHSIAKANPGETYCYTVTEPIRIVGRYCLRYEK